MKTIIEISKILKLSNRATQERFYSIGIKGKLRSKTYFYTDEQIKLISHKKSKNPNYPPLSHRNTYQDQVKIIEFYLSFEKINISELSRILNIDYLKCYKAINCYKKRNCLIIQSKL